MLSTLFNILGPFSHIYGRNKGDIIKGYKKIGKQENGQQTDTK